MGEEDWVSRMKESRERRMDGSLTASQLPAGSIASDVTGEQMAILVSDAARSTS